jgi:hypothetical protein
MSKVIAKKGGEERRERREKRWIFSIYIHMYKVFAPYSPSFTCEA